MLSIRNITTILSCILFAIIVNGRGQNLQKKSKLCGNVACDEVLFKTRVKRVMGVNNDPNFLKLVDSAIVDVYAVKFSDRFDIMEGRIGESRGFFYTGAIDMSPYAEFLRTAISEKKEMQMISQDPADFGEKRIIGVVHSELDLVRDYNAKATEVARENGLPLPELLPVPQPIDNSGHGHSHGPGGHGHSHGHSHETVKPATPPVTTTPAPIRETVKLATPPVPTTPAPLAETVSVPTPEAQPVINLNNVLAKSDTFDEDMEKFIQEDMEKHKRAALLKETGTIPEDPVVTSSQTVTPPPKEEVAATPEIKQVEPKVEVVVSQPEPVTPPPNVEVAATPEVEPITTPSPPQQVEVVVTPEPITVPPPPQVEIVTSPVEVPVTPSPIIPEDPVIAEPITPEVVDTPQEVAPEVVAADIPIPVVEVTTTPLPIETVQQPEIVPVQEELGTCYKDDCEGLQTTTTSPPPVTTPSPATTQEDADFLKWEAERLAASQPVQETSNYSHMDVCEPKVSSGLIDFIRSTFNLGNISDASIAFYVNLTFFLSSLILYLIVQSLSSSSEPEKFDRLAYFNLVTKHKELELKLKSAEALKGTQQEVVQPQNDQELTALKYQHQQLLNELQSVTSQRDTYEYHMNQWKVSSDEKQQEIEKLKLDETEYLEKLEKSSYGGQEVARELDHIRGQLNETQQIVLLRQEELNELRAEKDRYHQKYEEELENSRNSQKRIEELQELNNVIENDLKHTKNENASLTEVIQQYERNQNEGGSAGAESGGSGWSDFGENDEIEEYKKEEKTPESSQVGNIQNNQKELDELNKKIGELEKDVENYRKLYEKEKDGRINGSKSLDKKVEELEEEKRQLSARVDNLLKMFEKALDDSTKVREESIKKDKELREVEDLLKKKEEKLQEVDKEYKRWLSEYKKLETRGFHEVMQLKKQLDDLKTTQMFGGLTHQSPTLGEFGGAPVERLASPLDEPIWGEPEYPPKMAGGRQQMIPQQEDYFSSESMTLPNKKRISRRSVVGGGGGLTSPNDEKVSGKSKKENGASGSGTRRRSRSHGRQPIVYNDPFAPYIPPSSDSSFMSHPDPRFAPLNRRHSKSGQLHYSSGGSNNDARSPPPEMPLLSAIPPPGVRKPSSKRLDSSLHGK